MSRKFKEPTCIESWSTKHDINFSKEEWKRTFMLPFTLTKDVRLRELQFKILHRVYPSFNYISRFDTSVKSNCNTCNVKADIAHMFYYCSNVTKFWNDFEQWLCTNVKQMNINEPSIIFGLLSNRTVVENFLILHGKWFIHKGYKSCTEKQCYIPRFKNFLCYIKSVLECEKQIAINCRKDFIFDNILNML